MPFLAELVEFIKTECFSGTDMVLSDHKSKPNSILSRKLLEHQHNASQCPLSPETERVMDWDSSQSMVMEQGRNPRSNTYWTFLKYTENAGSFKSVLKIFFVYCSIWSNSLLETLSSVLLLICASYYFMQCFFNSLLVFLLMHFGLLRVWVVLCKSVFRQGGEAKNSSSMTADCGGLSGAKLCAL